MQWPVTFSGKDFQPSLHLIHSLHWFSGIETVVQSPRIAAYYFGHHIKQRLYAANQYSLLFLQEAGNLFTLSPGA